jgi:HD-like signal output (HDOD) protein
VGKAAACLASVAGLRNIVSSRAVQHKRVMGGLTTQTRTHVWGLVVVLCCAMLAEQAAAQGKCGLSVCYVSGLLLSVQKLLVYDVMLFCLRHATAGHVAGAHEASQLLLAGQLWHDIHDHLCYPRPAYARLRLIVAVPVWSAKAV